MENKDNITPEEIADNLLAPLYFKYPMERNLFRYNMVEELKQYTQGIVNESSKEHEEKLKELRDFCTRRIEIIQGIYGYDCEYKRGKHDAYEEIIEVVNGLIIIDKHITGVSGERKE